MEQTRRTRAAGAARGRAVRRGTRHAIGVLALIAGALVMVSGTASATPPSATPPGPCPVVTQNTNLTADCLGPLNIAADGVRVNLKGHTVICTNQATTDGIVLVGRQDVRVDNGEVENCRNGLIALNGGGHSFSKLHIGQGNVGLVLQFSHGNRLRQIDVVANDTRGLFVASSHDNELFDVNASANLIEGMRVGNVATPADPAHGNRLVGIVANDNVRDGIVFDQNVTDNELTFSEARRNGRTGLYLYGSDNLVAASRFNDTLGSMPGAANPSNGTGVFVVRAAAVPAGGNLITAVQADDNFGTGFHLYRSDGNVLRHNLARDNGVDGVAVGVGPEQATSAGNEVRSNRTSGNGGYDLADYAPGACTTNTWANTRTTSLYDGCEAS